MPPPSSLDWKSWGFTPQSSLPLSPSHGTPPSQPGKVQTAVRLLYLSRTWLLQLKSWLPNLVDSPFSIAALMSQLSNGFLTFSCVCPSAEAVAASI